MSTDTVSIVNNNTS